MTLVACGRPAAPPVAKPPVHGKLALKWVSNDVPASLRHGSEILARVAAQNDGDWAWPTPATASPSNPTGIYAVRLSCRWLHEDGNPVTAYDSRADLTANVAPGATANYTIKVTAPAAPGQYKLQFDLVEEMVVWFESKGNPKLMS